MGGSQLDEVRTAIDGYVVEKLLGCGGMGAVYRARQLSLGQPVAIKVLAPRLRAKLAFVTQFTSEARLQANLQHPHVLPVLDSGEAAGMPFIVMRLVDGFSLHELVRGNVLTASQAVDLLTGVAAALDHAHVRGVMHLDVKPQNVLVEGERHAWLADFGLTRRLGQSTGLAAVEGLLGSLDYLAPEIACGECPSPACDVYSLAVTAFHALSGRLPFPVASHAAGVLANASSPRPRICDTVGVLPPTLDAVLQRGLATDPAGRHASAGELIADVRAAFGLTRVEQSGWRSLPVREPIAADALGLQSSAPTLASQERDAVLV